MRGQLRREAGVERLALIVVDGRVVGTEVAGRVVGNTASKAADNVAALLGNLIGVSQMKLAEAGQSRRAQGQLPGADQGSIDGDGEVHIRFAEIGVIEEVVDAVFDVGHIEQPAFVGNLNAELVLFVALGGNGREGVFAGGLADWRS